MAAKTLPFLPSIAKGFPAVALGLLAISFCLAACSHKMAPQGHYQTTPIAADGLPDDWPLPLRFANASYTLRYDITNDTRNIYVCVLSRDEQTMLRMLRAGITVYFDPKGQNSRDISLHFPMRKQPDPNIRNRNGEPLTNGNDSALKAELLLQSDSYGTTGFSGIDNGQFAAGDAKSPIRVAIQFSHHDSLLVYEAIIPAALISGANPGSRNPKKPFSVGIVLNTPSGQTVAVNHHHSGGGRGLDNPPIQEDANWYQFRLAKS
ncbi:MAG TPA: hypothetical protein VFE32_12255 [Puia sp.]|jgi:hypothetical protein|nr:hypothetical protein [Puia sp.]